ncbi:uncharacterized protein LOC133302035 [Gastrolobium bilobum]|uniref:uncharacterized protein LOC133302035 n=1 Tax=Gastrolobium bilobum TaxID=150636 RepID=UPI002AAF3792|nr:uncharacterized protein LOC133302035 [Gastrolobium bilobum]
MTPARVPQTASIVRPQVDANNFELKPALLQLIQKDQFAGGSTEDPYIHLENFLLYCDTLKMNGVSRDAILLRLFPCSLKEEARAWERFKGLLRKCPQHGIEAWEQARTFFQGMTPNTRTLVNAASGGFLKTKTPEEALELLESLASQEYDNAPVPQRRAGIMKLDGCDAILAQNEQILQSNKKQQQQLDALAKQFSEFQVSSVNTPAIICDICAGTHATEDCQAPETADVNGIWHDQKALYNPGRNQYDNNQNQGWRNKNQNQHPGFSYSSNHQLNPPMPVQQQPPQQSEWEKAFAQLSKTTSDYIQSSNNFREDTSAFMQETRASFRNQEASIRNLETQIGQLSKQFTERVQGTFPGNTIPNPSREHCNAITTMSEKAIEPVVKPSVEKKKDDDLATEKEKEKEVAKEFAA